MVALAPVVEVPIVEVPIVEAPIVEERIVAAHRQTSLLHQSLGWEDLESLATEACSAAPLVAFAACLAEVDQAAAREDQEVC